MNDILKLREEYEELKEKVTNHAFRYYVLDDPVISDAEYDKLYRQLQEMEEKHQIDCLDSPTKKVGGEPLKDFKEVTHSSPMLSIKNSMDEKEAVEFNARIAEALGVDPDEVEYFAELKHDGLSCAIRYQYGNYQLAATRGNGEVGEDVTEQVKTIKNVPLSIGRHYRPQVDEFEIRGEIVMYKKDFDVINEARILAGEKPFKNVRNAAAGSIRQLDPKITAGRRLRFIPYSLHGISSDLPQQYRMFVMGRMGFQKDKHCRIVHGYKGMQQFYNEMLAIRHTIPHEIDGIVFKVNDCSKYDLIGYTSNTPKWATAYKFPAEEQSTVLTDIDVQIGRSGAVTPVGRLEGVFVGGVTVTNATLHNEDHIKKLGCAPGDRVIVRRAGDVVPEISALAEIGPGPRFIFPTECPHCRSPLVRADGEADHYCTGGLKCPAQRLYSITHFGSRKAMDIEGLGEGTVEKLINAGLISKISDLFYLNPSDVAKIEGMGKLSADKLINNIRKTKGIDLHRLINALGIPGVGEVTAKDIARRFKSWGNFVDATEVTLLGVDGLGPVTAKNIRRFLEDPEVVREVTKIVMNVEPYENRLGFSTGVFSGMTFVLSGTFSKGKDPIKHELEMQGAKIAGSVSKKTSYLVAGPGAGEKLAKATKLGITVLNEEQVLDLINKGKEQ